MKTFRHNLTLLLFLLTAVYADNTNTRTFTNVQLLGKDSITINGAILQIGNQILCKNDADFATCQAPDLGSPNNANIQHFARIDTSVNHSNTMAKLVMQPGDEVVYAGLYWSARVVNITDAELTAAKSIKIKGPASSTYTTFTSSDAKFNWWNTDDDIHSGYFDYGASADVTQYIQDNGAGNYYVGDIIAQSGSTGMYASWQLVVIVKNATRSLKNIALYDGFQSIFSSAPYPESVTVDAGGFITPTGGDPFNAYLYVYAGETDTPYGDSSEIVDGNGNWVSLVDGANTPNDVMNASVYSPDYTNGYRSNDAGMADPNFRNVLGVDIDKLQINDKTDTSKQILGSGQTSTQIRLSSSGDRYSLNMFAFETEVFVPDFCYDYSYKQQGIYFTEPNDGTQPPYISDQNGTKVIIPHEPIEVTMYIKSLVDNALQIQNMTVNVDDINTSQATYIQNVSPDPVPNTNTRVAKTGDLYSQTVTVNSGTLNGMDYIHDIPIGTLDQNEYFYLYYSLDPQSYKINMPIHVQASYDLVLDTTSVSYTLTISQEIPLCTTSNFNYAPAKGIFNIVHSDYYDLDEGGSNAYYNLPTQVASREGNFKVLSMDPDNLDNLKGTATIVAVEMIDASAFHDTNASCEEIESAITQRVWIPIGDLENEINATSALFNQAALATAIANGDVSVKQNFPSLTNSADFYKNVRQNTAFRVSWNEMDENGTLPYVSKVNTGTTVSLNWTEEWSGSTCAQDMVTNGYGNDNQVASYCNFTGGSPDTIAACMECIYGVHTRVVCSRDNFSIRPEAFNLQLDDQNQTNPTQQADITTLSNSGSTGATAPASINLAAGYDYNIEINATNHINNSAAPGYTKTFNLSDADEAKYTWAPLATQIVSGCNDDSNKTIEEDSGGSLRFLNGVVDRNTSLNNVGRYLLTVVDRTWTSVDSNASYMSHHSGSYFTNTLDCRTGSSVVLNVNAGVNPLNPATLNGCDINSSHTNTETNLRYNDYNVTFFPYKFDINGSGTSNSAILPSVGIKRQLIDTTNNFFVYMSDINNTNDENMSYHLDGSIAALGENNVTLNNFVDKCYAANLTVAIQTTNRDLNDTEGNHVNFLSVFFDLNKTTGKPIASLDVNTTDTTPNVTQFSFDTNTSHFYKDSNGSIDTYLNLNYQKNVSRTVNPKTVTFLSYGVDCAAGVNCFFNADLITNKTPQMQKDLNTTIPIQFYYGRAHAGKQRYQVPDDSPYPANIYYEVYCFGNGCDTNVVKSINPQLTHVDDIRWYQNPLHSASNDGNTTAVFEQDGINKVTPTYPFPPLWNSTNPATVQLTYDGSLGYPYTTTMEINASGWLIYNENNANATSNPFQVEFNQAGTGWSGERETSTTTKAPNTSKTNRRTMW